MIMKAALSIAILHFTYYIVHATSFSNIRTRSIGSKKPFNVIVVGGSSGMGKASAKEVVAQGMYDDQFLVVFLPLLRVSSSLF